MPFECYLTSADLDTLRQAALDGDVLAFERALWLQGIRRGFVGRLHVSPRPLNQFELDLAALNCVERLEDGTVPLTEFLRNVARLLRSEGKPQAAVFDLYGNRIGNRTQGIGALPNPQQLPEVVRPQAVVHQDDTLAIGFLSAALAVGRSVGIIKVPRFELGQQRMVAAGRPWITNGTGWLIGPDLFITNHHVINARADGEAAAASDDFERQAAGASVAFDFDAENSATQVVGVAKLEAADAALDYAIVRVAPAPKRSVLALNRTPVTVAPTSYQPVNIIQHPQAQPKRIACRNNLVSGADENSVRYFTDTDFGSSGAPVCDDAWRVVGLHRGAAPVTNVSFQGKSTAYVNIGTQIQAVLAHLAGRFEPLHQEILAAQPHEATL